MAKITPFLTALNGLRCLQRKQKDVQKENGFYTQLLQQALPSDQQSNTEKQKGKRAVWEMYDGFWTPVCLSQPHCGGKTGVSESALFCWLRMFIFP